MVLTPLRVTQFYNIILYSGEKAVILEKSRQSRLHLRKYLKSAKSANPEASCSLENERLVVDGKVYVYSEAAGRVVNRNVENTETSEEVSEDETEHDM